MCRDHTAETEFAQPLFSCRERVRDRMSGTIQVLSEIWNGVSFSVSGRPFYTEQLPVRVISARFVGPDLFHLKRVIIETSYFDGVRVVRQGPLLGGFRQDSERFRSAETTALALGDGGRITARFGREIEIIKKGL
ncbi:unnamed protein product [Lasius platythorax]|uniref:Uncharacterized protein n=1 Tax=Lasius platythorax TaxID=488582 RepID=A0AAV2MZ38_9HYME